MKKTNTVFTTDHVQDKYANKVLGYIKFVDGSYYPIEKQGIRTHLCYGYGYGISYEDAGELAEAARTEYDFFESEQLREVNRWIKSITRAIDTTKMIEESYRDHKCCCFGHDDLIWMRKGCYRGELIADRCFDNNLEAKDALCLADLESLLEGYKALAEYIKKRAKAYWKRFGGSKLHTWTYDRND